MRLQSAAQDAKSSSRTQIREELVNGDTHSTSPSEGLVCRTAEGQHRLWVTVDMEGSSEPWPRDEQGRPSAQTPPRPLTRVLPGADGQHSTPGSDLEHQANHPVSQLEDLEPTVTESNGRPCSCSCKRPRTGSNSTSPAGRPCACSCSSSGTCICTSR
ncbi:hypothetical protein CB1_001735012 [Camelus ferus]|nr:hypothetical protein CB1_001735012 [Camelus ferus]